MAFLSLIHNKSKLLLKTSIRILELLLLSTGLISTFLRLKEVKMMPYSFEIVLSSLVKFSNSIRYFLSHHLYKSIFVNLIVMLIAVLSTYFLNLRETTELEDSGGFFEYHTDRENDVRAVHETPKPYPPQPPPSSPPVQPPAMDDVKGVIVGSQPPLSSKVNKIDVKSPPDLASRSSTWYEGSSNVDYDCAHTRPNLSVNDVLSSPARRFSSEAHMSKPGEIKKRSYSLYPSIDHLEPTKPIEVKTYPPSRKDTSHIVDNSARTWPNSKEQKNSSEKDVLSSPARRFSNEAHVPKTSEMEEKSYSLYPSIDRLEPTKPIEVKTYSPSRKDSSHIVGNSGGTWPNSAEQKNSSEKDVLYSPAQRFASEVYVSKNHENEKNAYSLNSAMIDPLEPSKTMKVKANPQSEKGISSHVDDNTARTWPNSTEQIITSEKFVLSSPAGQFLSEAHLSNARELGKKTYSPKSSIDPSESTKTNKVKTNPPTIKGKEEIIIENLPGENGSEEYDTIEDTWEAISRGGNKKTKKKQLKKSETWEIAQRRRRDVHIERLDSEEVLPSSPLWKELKKSLTFNDTISAILRGGRMRRDDALSRDEFNKRIDGFIKAKKDDMGDEQEKSRRMKFLDFLRRDQ